MSEQSTPTTPVCCGQLSGAWVPGEGKPVALGCQLCPHSPTYWRTAKGAPKS